MRQIMFYTLDGKLKESNVLNEKTLADINGKMVRCHMQDGTYLDGYADPYRIHADYDHKIHDVIYLQTWDNLDESGHWINNDESKYKQTFTPVKLDQVKDIEVILFSSPRFGTRISNHFFIDSGYEKKEASCDE